MTEYITQLPLVGNSVRNVSRRELFFQTGNSIVVYTVTSTNQQASSTNQNRLLNSIHINLSDCLVRGGKFLSAV